MLTATAWMDRRFFPRHADNWDDLALRERVLSELKSGMRLLDVGAGAGVAPYSNYRGVAGKVCGIDCDPRVLENCNLDDAHIADAASIPYPADTFDVAICNNVLEHLDDPEAIFREVGRVLKPGGAIIFKTPNRWHYVALIAQLTPLSFHRAVMRWRGTRTADDVFVTRYRANTVRRLKALARTAGLNADDISPIEGRPEYLRSFAPAYAAGTVYERLVNALPFLRHFRAVLIGSLHKPHTR